MYVETEITFTGRGFIAEPYWPARERLINVQKESGVNRARSEVNRTKALRDYLTAHDMTMDDYHTLEVAAARPFYTWEDVSAEVDGKDPDEIVVAAHELYGCLAQAAGMASTSIRLARPEQIRTVLRVSDFATGKNAADGIWERFVTVSAGTGQKLSNQRALRSSAYLGPDTTASGTLSFSEEIVREERVKDFLAFAGRDIGVGASRKLDWGRFTITGWDAHP